MVRAGNAMGFDSLSSLPDPGLLASCTRLCHRFLGGYLLPQTSSFSFL